MVDEHDSSPMLNQSIYQSMSIFKVVKVIMTHPE